MRLRVRYRGGDGGGRVLTFPEDLSSIRFGRDPGCEVVFDSGERSVGRHHCSLVRAGTAWRVVAEPGYLIRIDGRRVEGEVPIEGDVELQLGPGGPRVRIEEDRDRAGMASTLGQDADGGTRTLLELLRRRHRALGIGLAALAALVLGGFAAVRFWPPVPEHARLLQALHRAREAVYLVLVRQPDGGLQAHATAWVVSKTALATNAHVAAEIERALESGKEVIARSRQGRDVSIEAVEVHPGFREFRAVLRKYDPGAPGREGVVGFRSNVPVCDVALLRLHSPDELKPVLPIAPVEVLESLEAGDLVGAVQHPIDGRTAGGDPEWRAIRPEPVVQPGSITAVTDFLLLASDVDRSIVHHSIPTSGGSSGSPILNADGQVVAIHSAGETVPVSTTGLGQAGSATISTGVGIGYAQNAVLLRELLSEDAELAQRDRTDRWHAALAALPTAEEVELDWGEGVHQRYLEDWKRRQGIVEVEEVTEEGLIAAKLGTDWRLAGADTAPPRSNTTLTLAAGRYLVVVLPRRRGSYLATVQGTAAGAAAQQGSGWHPTISFELESPRDIELRLEGNTQSRARVLVYRAEAAGM